MQQVLCRKIRSANPTFLLSSSTYLPWLRVLRRGGRVEIGGRGEEKRREMATSRGISGGAARGGGCGAFFLKDRLRWMRCGTQNC